MSPTESFIHKLDEKVYIGAVGPALRICFSYVYIYHKQLFETVLRKVLHLSESLNHKVFDFCAEFLSVKLRFYLVNLR